MVFKRRIKRTGSRRPALKAYKRPGFKVALKPTRKLRVSAKNKYVSEVFVVVETLSTEVAPVGATKTIGLAKLIKPADILRSVMAMELFGNNNEYLDYGLESMKVDIMPYGGTIHGQARPGGVHGIMQSTKPDADYNNVDAYHPSTLASNQFAKIRPLDKKLTMKFNFPSYARRHELSHRSPFNDNNNAIINYLGLRCPKFVYGMSATCANDVQVGIVVPYALMRVTVKVSFRGRPK